MAKVKLAVVGVGGMGSHHVRSIGNLKDTVELVAVCDIRKERADEIAAANNCQAFYSAEELYKSGLVEAVIVATPHYAHTPLMIQAFDHGIHVLVEKPIAVHKKDAAAMVEAAEKHPELKFAAMFNQRTLNIHKKIKELLDNGELGKIKRINWIITSWYRTQAYYNSGGWRATWAGEGGGVLLNQCPHQLDLFQWFFGLPKKVRANCSISKYHNIEVEDDVTAYMEYEDGATAVFITSTGESPGTNRLEVTGDRGRLVYENGKLEFLRTVTSVQDFINTSTQGFANPEVWRVEIPVAADSGPGQHQKIIENYVDAIQNDAPLIANGVEGINSVQLGNAMLYSSMKDQAADMPLDGDAFAEMLNELIETSTFKKETKDGKSFDVDGTF